VVDLRLHCLDKDATPPDIFKNRFYELCESYQNFYRIYTDGSKTGDRVGAAVVHRNKTKCVRLLNTASIFRAELYALLIAKTLFAAQRRKNCVILSDSMSSLQAIRGFKIELGLIQRFMINYSTHLKMLKQ